MYYSAMVNKKIKAPPYFKSEKEESEWWDKNSTFILEEFRRAQAEGRLGHGRAIVKAVEKQAAKSITIRLDEGDLELAKRQAKQKGLRYQTYLKMLLHDALQKEEKKSA